MAAVVPRSADINYSFCVTYIGFGELSGPKTAHFVLSCSSIGGTGFELGCGHSMFEYNGMCSEESVTECKVHY